MPYGRVGDFPVPGGVLNDWWYFTTVNATTEPYILINQTDVQMWQFGPFYPDGSQYALQWELQWSDPIKPCNPDPFGVFGTLFFNINLDSPEPELGNLTGQCPQLGGVYEIDTTAKNSSCLAVVTNGGTGDKALVGSISSAVQNLITASAAAAFAETASPSTTAPALPNIALSPDVPLPYVLAATFLVSLQMVVSL